MVWLSRAFHVWAFNITLLTNSLYQWMKRTKFTFPFMNVHAVVFAKYQRGLPVVLRVITRMNQGTVVIRLGSLNKCRTNATTHRLVPCRNKGVFSPSTTALQRSNFSELLFVQGNKSRTKRTLRLNFLKLFPMCPPHTPPTQHNLRFLLIRKRMPIPFAD